jgi:hypothetical protein
VLLFVILIDWLDPKVISEADGAAAILLRVLEYERKKGDGKENEQDGLSGTIELLLSALAECNPTDEDKLCFLESGLQRLMSKYHTPSSSRRVIALKLSDKFSGESKITVSAISGCCTSNFQMHSGGLKRRLFA